MVKYPWGESGWNWAPDSRVMTLLPTLFWVSWVGVQGHLTLQEDLGL